MCVMWRDFERQRNRMWSVTFQGPPGRSKIGPAYARLVHFRCGTWNAASAALGSLSLCLACLRATAWRAVPLPPSMSSFLSLPVPVCPYPSCPQWWGGPTHRLQFFFDKKTKCVWLKI